MARDSLSNSYNQRGIRVGSNGNRPDDTAAVQALIAAADEPELHFIPVDGVHGVTVVGPELFIVGFEPYSVKLA